MKKVLLGTSAVALVGAYATTAGAAEWEVRIGGFMDQSIGYASSDVSVAGVELSDSVADFDGVDTLSNAEIIFRPGITLDNGLRFGVQVQLEANTSGDQIDESFASIDGSFGRILIGSENSAGSLTQIAAPSVALNGHNSGTLTAFIPFSGTAAGAEVGSDTFRGTLGSTFLENARNNDVGRITYFTPRLFGLQLGFSYARDFNEDNDAQVNLADAYGDIIDLGANYTNSFSGIDIALSGRWGIIATTPADNTATLNQDESENPTVYGFGASVSAFGFTVGGSFAEQNNSPADDGTAFDIGVAYETGPWGFSFSYLNGENVDDGLSAGTTVLGADETLDVFVGAVNYALADGVDLNVYGAYVDFEEDFSSETGTTLAPGEEVDGFIIGAGVALGF